MRQLAYRVYNARYQVSFELGQMKFSQKHTKLQRYVTDCLKIFHLYFRLLIIIQLPGKNPILTKHISKNPLPTAVEIFLISIFGLKQTCKIVPTENY